MDSVSQFPLIAGHPALDLCNTVDWRLVPGSEVERLTGYDAVLTWSQAVDLLTPAEADTIAALPDTAAEGPRQVQLLRELRETAYRLFVDRDDHDADTLSQVAADTYAACQLTRTGSAWEWSEPRLNAHTPRRRAVIVLVDLLRSLSMRDVRQCDDAACGWLYLDTSPRRNRRWCVSSECGNRNRVRRHYQRRREQAAAGLTPAARHLASPQAGPAR